MKQIDEKIASMARAINKQSRKLASVTGRKIRNTWACEDGRIESIEDSTMLQNRVDKEQKTLDDMIMALDILKEERDNTHE